jgi:hypothetical protein
MQKGRMAKRNSTKKILISSSEKKLRKHWRENFFWHFRNCLGGNFAFTFNFFLMILKKKKKNQEVV